MLLIKRIYRFTRRYLCGWTDILKKTILLYEQIHGITRRRIYTWILKLKYGRNNRTSYIKSLALRHRIWSDITGVKSAKCVTFCFSVRSSYNDVPDAGGGFLQGRVV